jgi:hypothetical protein
MGVSGQRHTLAALYPREGTLCTHWIGGWVGLRAGLDTKRPEGERSPGYARSLGNCEIALDRFLEAIVIYFSRPLHA